MHWLNLDVGKSIGDLPINIFAAGRKKTLTTKFAKESRKAQRCKDERCKDKELKSEATPRRLLPGRTRLGCLAGSDAVAGRGIYVEGLDFRFSLQQGFQHVSDAVVVLAMIALRILFRFPEADSNFPLPLGLVREVDQVHKSGLLLQNG